MLTDESLTKKARRELVNIVVNMCDRYTDYIITKQTKIGYAKAIVSLFPRLIKYPDSTKGGYVSYQHHMYIFCFRFFKDF